MAKGKVKTEETMTEITDIHGNKTKVESKKVFIVPVDEADRFFMVYISMLQSFYEIKYVKDVKLLVKLAELANYNTGHVEISSKLRKYICGELGFNQSNLSATLKRLVVLGLLQGDGGSYQLNAGLFWKGDAETRKQIMREMGIDLTIKFTMTPNAEFDKKD